MPPERLVRGFRERFVGVPERERLGKMCGDPEERSLFGHPLFVLAQQLRNAHGQSDLTGYGLGQRDLVVAPSARRRTVEGEHPDQFVEDHDRDGEDRTGAETQQRFTALEQNVLELRRRLDILDRQGLAAFHRKVRNGETPRGLDRLQTGLLPLHGRDVAVRAEPDQAAVHRRARGRSPPRRPATTRRCPAPSEREPRSGQRTVPGRGPPPGWQSSAPDRGQAHTRPRFVATYASSSEVNARCFETEPATTTAMTRSSSRTGMNATLFAPVASTMRR